jgi:nicotinamide-nucleotide amidase
MRCEVIAVGTELLLGQIVDTNSSWIGEQLALAGIDTHFQTKVGDNADRIASSIELALSRSDAIIMCGGLGPTQDDITRDVIASVMGVELIRRDDIADRIRAMFETRGRTMPQNNLRQADVPDGASIMDQMPGTAPGLVCPVGDKVIYAVPGVPSEMREMALGTIVPDLQLRSGETAVIGSRVLRTWGHSESGLAEMLADRIDELDAGGAATIAFLASGAEGLKVRITAKAPSDGALAAILDDEEVVLRGLLGDLVFGLDDDTMESVTLQLLADQGMTLGVFEQVTGGYLTSRLSGHAVAASVLQGSLIAGNPALADQLMGTPAADVQEAAGLLAKAAREQLGSDVGLAVGRSTPRDSGGVDVAVAWVVGDQTKTWSVPLPGDTERMRQYSGITLLNDLRQHLLTLDPT